MTADHVRAGIRASIETLEKIEADADAIAAVADAIVERYRAGGKLILFGNGGSAADAQHIAAEFVGRFQLERDPLPAVALSVNPSAVTAIGNDYGFDKVFSRQLRALGSERDIAFGLSTSGNSENVLRAFEAAREMGMVTVGLTGGTGGAMPAACDHCIVVPDGATPRIQEGHLVVYHLICELVERALFPDA